MHPIRRATHQYRHADHARVMRSVCGHDLSNRLNLCGALLLRGPLRLTAVLVDLSGTLHVGASAIPGAAAALARLRQSGLKVCSVSLALMLCSSLVGCSQTTEISCQTFVTTQLIRTVHSAAACNCWQ